MLRFDRVREARGLVRISPNGRGVRLVGTEGHSAAEHYSVGRRTVARVLRKLADDGLLVIRERWGIFRA